MNKTNHYCRDCAHLHTKVSITRKCKLNCVGREPGDVCMDAPLVKFSPKPSGFTVMDLIEKLEGMPRHFQIYVRTQCTDDDKDYWKMTPEDIMINDVVLDGGLEHLVVIIGEGRV